MNRRRIFRSVVVGTAGILALPFLAVNANATTSAVSTPSDVSVPDTAPAWATPANTAGTPSSTDKVSIRVALQLRSAGSAESAALAVSDPSSRSYGAYLTPAQFNARYAPSDASVARVKSFLTTSGLAVTGLADGNRWVSASGTVAQLNKAFSTTLKTYTYHGDKLRAPSSDVKVPTAVAADVSTVTGLTQDSTLHHPQTTKVPEPVVSAKKTAGSTPAVAKPPLSQCSDYWGEFQQTVPKVDGKTSVNTYICGYDPAQLRKTYGTDAVVKSGTTGRGVTVAIIDAYASSTMEADANAYATTFGEPTFKKGQYTETTFGPFDEQTECAGEEGWNGEETLDVEAVHGMAPGANIHYIGAQNCDAGIDDALNYVVQNHTADIVSNSYGDLGEDIGTDEIALEHSIFLQAALEGMGMYFSSGDDGDDVVDGLSPTPDYPASDPLVTSVGGTALLLDKKNNVVAQTGWETSLDFIDYSGTTPVYEGPLPGDFYGGAGGGTSTVFAQPSYQSGVVPNSLSKVNGKQKMRVVPDVAALADPYTGFYIGETVDGEFGISSIGGTSVAAPLIAGIQAVASQHRIFPIGFANPLLYNINSHSFSDVLDTPKPIRFASVGGSYTGTFNTGDTQTTTPGYDNTTGRGTPNGVTFLLSELIYPFRF